MKASSRGLLTEDGALGEYLGTHVEGAPVGSMLLQVVRAHARVGAQLLSEVNLVSPQELVLLHLEANRYVAQSDLVRYLDRDRSTVTATLQVMERGGLVTRVLSQSDGRIMMVKLTPEGRIAARHSHHAWAQLEKWITHSLSASQQSQLLTMLAAMRNDLSETLLEMTRGTPGEK